MLMAKSSLPKLHQKSRNVQHRGHRSSSDLSSRPDELDQTNSEDVSGLLEACGQKGQNLWEGTLR